jgi:hypothetical protein
MKARRSYRLRKQKFPPCWTTYYQLGVEASKHLPAFSSFVAIGRAFGITKQNAYTECVVALGKLVYRMRAEHSDPL